VIKLKLAHLQEGESRLSRRVTPDEAGLADADEFGGAINLSFAMNKIGREIFIRASITTSLDLICDRCLEPFQIQISEKTDLVVTPDSSVDDEAVFPMNDEIDITGTVRDTLVLAIPLKKVCREDCRGLCPRCGANLNREECTCEDVPTDPRWEALKRFKENDNL